MTQDVQVTTEKLVMPGLTIDQFGISLTGALGTVQTLANTNTITVAQNQSAVRVTAAGAVTGIIIAPGVRAYQLLVIIHEGAAANTLTMAAAGTSNVAGGVTCVLSGLAAHIMVWDSITALWSQVGPATN